MSVVNVHAAKTQLSRLIDAAAAGEEVIIARAGKPVVKLVPVDQAAFLPPRRLGILEGKIHVPDDFDDPLPDEIIAEFEGR
jgi:prevent-host-death family protein